MVVEADDCLLWTNKNDHKIDCENRDPYLNRNLLNDRVISRNHMIDPMANVNDFFDVAKEKKAELFEEDLS